MRAKTYLLSVGYLAQMFQKPPTTIAAILDEAGIAPELSINGVNHFGEAGYNALAERFEPKGKPIHG